MKKKILAILMATLTVGSLLSGCGGAQSGDAAGKQESGKQESSDSKEPAEVGIVYVELVVVCDTPHVVVIGWFYFQYTVG